MHQCIVIYWSDIFFFFNSIQNLIIYYIYIYIIIRLCDNSNMNLNVAAICTHTKINKLIQLIYMFHKCVLSSFYFQPRACAVAFQGILNRCVSSSSSSSGQALSSAVHPGNEDTSHEMYVLFMRMMRQKYVSVENSSPRKVVGGTVHAW